MPDKPNVLLITTDHWPASLLGIAGHAAIQTPTLDQLAKNGRRFTRAYSECPICIPARRSLMTGTSPRTHGDRIYKERLRMPGVPTLAQTFRNAGYQAFAVGKLHVYPQRDRIGFDDVILDEEGRTQFGIIDDYDLFLGDAGFPGKQFAHGMSNNEYVARPWHLPDELHVTNWATEQMARTIKRRDPTRPAFWYLSYRHPHPPLAPLQCYLDMYRDIDPGTPFIGEWAKDFDALPHALKTEVLAYGGKTEHFIRAARRAFYALCTHIDHQLRIVIGTLRDEKLLDNTILLFHSDHGDMLGNHGLWHKAKHYEDSAGIPMILVGTAGDSRVGHHATDDRLVCLQDVMPTLLDLAGIEIPKSVEGISMLSSKKRDWLYSEWGENPRASRMMRDGRYKLIYYPVGNRTQLFDLQKDPREMKDLSATPSCAAVLTRLTNLLIAQFYGGDEKWAKNEQLIGLPDQSAEPQPDRGLGANAESIGHRL